VQSTGEDGGAYRLYLDDKLIVDNWSTQKALTSHVTLSLDSKPHKIVLEQKGRSVWLGGRLKMGIARQGAIVDANAKMLAAKADAVVVAVGFSPETESEGADRTFSLPPGQNELIQEMAGANKNTIVVVTSGGSFDTNAWLDRVSALIEAWYPGQEGGAALAQVIFGDVNPSGRLPITFERVWEDNPAYNSYYPVGDTKRVEYKEGIFVGYRGYEHYGKKPLFPFGYGLSYTTFKYGNLSIKSVTGGAPSGPLYEVSFDVQNTGSREGSEVAQVYVGDTHAKLPRPARELKGFAKASLRPGETKRVAVRLDGRAFSYYDVDTKQWRAESGDFDILVGRSSAQIELRGKLTLATGITSK
jgi:beta-glucosidase